MDPSDTVIIECLAIATTAGLTKHLRKVAEVKPTSKYVNESAQTLPKENAVRKQAYSTLPNTVTVHAFLLVA